MAERAYLCDGAACDEGAECCYKNGGNCYRTTDESHAISKLINNLPVRYVPIGDDKEEEVFDIHSVLTMLMHNTNESIDDNRDKIVKAFFYTSINEIALFISIVDDRLLYIDKSRKALAAINDASKNDEIKKLYDAYNDLYDSWGRLSIALKSIVLDYGNF